VAVSFEELPQCGDLARQRRSSFSKELGQVLRFLAFDRLFCHLGCRLSDTREGRQLSCFRQALELGWIEFSKDLRRVTEGLDLVALCELSLEQVGDLVQCVCGFHRSERNDLLCLLQIQLLGLLQIQQVPGAGEASACRRGGEWLPCGSCGWLSGIHLGSGGDRKALLGGVVSTLNTPSTPGAEWEVETTNGDVVVLGPLAEHETADLFVMFSHVVATREGYPQSPPLIREEFDNAWVRPVSIVVAARIEGQMVGAYYLKPNFPGRASHIANAGYLVESGMRGRGIGRTLVEDSIWRAPLVGFDAIQFNLVFESNPARALYEQLGWREIGRLPDAVDGEDAVIYWRRVGN
jgi:GNAT superfamily N-acetyltransferase